LQGTHTHTHTHNTEDRETCAVGWLTEKHFVIVWLRRGVCHAQGQKGAEGTLRVTDAQAQAEGRPEATALQHLPPRSRSPAAAAVVLLLSRSLSHHHRPVESRSHLFLHRLESTHSGTTSKHVQLLLSAQLIIFMLCVVQNIIKNDTQPLGTFCWGEFTNTFDTI
jgi:hypothetical protein